MILIILKWWYTAGWIGAFDSIKQKSSDVARAFSVVILIKTLFAPWKRIMTYGGRSLGDKLRALVDNLISRVVGFCVRIIVLIIATLFTLFTACVYFVLAIIWPFVPIAIIYCLYRGVTG